MNLFAGVLANYIFFYVYNDGKIRYGVDESNISSWKTGMISLKAGVIASTITCPFWVIKTRLALNRNKSDQGYGMLLRTVRDMYRHEGILKFYAGYLPSLFMSLHGVIQMYAYENINKAVGFQTGQKMTRDNFLIPFFTGGISKSCAAITLMPIMVVRLRLQMKQFSTNEVQHLGLKVSQNQKEEIYYKGMTDIVTKIYKNEGILAFYKGLTPSLIRGFLHSGLFFLTYESAL
jgi:hypothetical protein